MEVMKMTRLMKVLAIAVTALYIIPGCDLQTGNGLSFIPNFSTTDILAALGL
jgi:hypothetical protein